MAKSKQPIVDPDLVTATNPRGKPLDSRTSRREDDGVSAMEEAVGKALTDAETYWTRLSQSAEIRAGAKMACPECGGAGTINHGGFGASPCYECDGKKIVDDPLAEPVEVPMPDFVALRTDKTLTLAQAKKVLTDGHAFAKKVREQNKLNAGRVEKLLPKAADEERETFGSLGDGGDWDDDGDPK